MSSRPAMPLFDTKRRGRFGLPAVMRWGGGDGGRPFTFSAGQRCLLTARSAAGSTKTVQRHQFDQSPECRAANGEGRVGQCFANDRAHRRGPFGSSGGEALVSAVALVLVARSGGVRPWRPVM